MNPEACVRQPGQLSGLTVLVEPPDGAENRWLVGCLMFMYWPGEEENTGGMCVKLSLN